MNRPADSNHCARRRDRRRLGRARSARPACAAARQAGWRRTPSGVRIQKLDPPAVSGCAIVRPCSAIASRMTAPSLANAWLMPRHQRIVVAEREEIGDRALDLAGRMAQDRGPQRASLADEGFGGDEIAEAQARKERFGERADIDDPAVAIERLQRRHGRAGRRTSRIRSRPRRSCSHERARGWSRARRRSIGMVTLVGQWWLGVVKTASTPSGRLSKRMPSSSTGTSDEAAARMVEDRAQAGIAGILHRRRAALV